MGAAGEPLPAPRQTLTPRRIAAAAVAIADADGLGAITMRRLAAELDVVPMAAYRYVSGKDDVLELMVDHVYAELQPLAGSAGWRESMRAFASRTRDLILAHPWLAQLPPETSLSLTPHRVAATEQALSELDGIGLDPDTMMAVVQTVAAYVHGIVGSEVALRQWMRHRGWASGDEMRTELAPQMRWLLGTGRYPVFHHYIGHAAHKGDPQWQFDSGLDLVLDGIAARLGPGGTAA
ncbi:TetR/AcrR family transcriptional regulator [Streptomyces stramineus]